MSRIRFDAALPINARREEIQAAVDRHAVVIVCGETGSGKTTQLPKMLLEMGRDKPGRIGHTQPRRIAARSVAARIAEEIGSELGGIVGCKVRFHEQVGGRTAIKLMTDGILLAETQGDRDLREYGSIILDEAHERSLNIDFLLGYVKRLVARRPELRVVVTSATIDAERFSRHFDGAPVIEVSGRLYPVEVRYRPVAGDAEDTTRDEEEAALADAVDELRRGEPISQAAARQRAGRCGRVAHGVCIRLYSEEDHDKRPAFTDPELLRSSLASVILRAKSLGLGEVADFPFLDPPISRAIADGYALLAELGAVDDANELTTVGSELARLPLDPRIGRMLIAGREERCLEQVRLIAAALSVQDPRERPLDKAAAADERHAQFADDRSDFLAFLKMGQLFEHKMEKAARENFLSIPRMREWRDVAQQLARTLHELGWEETSVHAERAEGYRAIHRALLAGLLGNVGVKDEPEASYTGARGIKFWIHPGSWAKKPGRWNAACELVETSRLFARTIAAIEPRWLEEIGAHLIRREHYETQWGARRGEVSAAGRGPLYGLPVYSNRRVGYGPIDPPAAHEIFIRSALVHGELETRAPFLAHNRRLVAEIERLEHKSRRPDILVDEDLIHAFYAGRVPQHTYSAAAFEQWRVRAERDDKKRLYLSREDLMRHEAAGITTANFPPQVELGPNRFALDYHFEPGSARDGVTMTVPLALLNQVPVTRTDWLVPGLLKEKVRTLAKGIPQRLRHKLGTLDDFAAAFAAAAEPSNTALASAIARYIRDEFNLDVPQDAFRPDSVPPHLRMNFRVVDEEGRQRSMGRDLAAIQRELGEEAKSVLQQEAPVDEGARYTAWTMGSLPEIMEIERGGQTLVGYPALVDAADAVTLQVFESPDKARAEHAEGVRRLAAIAFRDRVRDLERTLANDSAP